jgi:hypothetical protein
MYPASAREVTYLDWLLYLGGFVYWLFCVHRFHKVLAEATAGKYPISPRDAVGYHFLPLYNLYWIFYWPNTLARFVNERNSPPRMVVGLAGGLLLAGFLACRLDSALGLTIIFSVSVYLKNGIRRAVATPMPETKIADV